MIYILYSTCLCLTLTYIVKPVVAITLRPPTGHLLTNWIFNCCIIAFTVSMTMIITIAVAMSMTSLWLNDATFTIMEMITFVRNSSCHDRCRAQGGRMPPRPRRAAENGIECGRRATNKSKKWKWRNQKLDEKINKTKMLIKRHE